MNPSSLPLHHLWLLSLIPLSLASDSKQGNSSLTCWYDSRAALLCDWNSGRDLADAPCNLTILSKYEFCDSSLEFSYLKLRSNKKSEHCVLPKAEHMSGLRRCIKIFSKDYNMQCFTAADHLTMSVHCQTGENRSIPAQLEDFSPLQNIKLWPPGDLQLFSKAKNTYNLTWSLNISSHYLNGKREYEVRYRTTSQPWEEAKTFIIKQDQMWVPFERLSPNMKYEAVVRVKPGASSTCRGVWSDWSKTVLWSTHAEGTSGPVLPAIIVSTCIFVIVGTAFLINLRTPRWFKKILKIHIPDPEKFFPPLISVHGGDIQKWLSSPFSTSSMCVNSTAPEISMLEVMQKNDLESQLSKGALEPEPPLETSGHSLSSCFTNQGYFFFHLPNSFEIEPCQVYFTYEPFTQESNGSENSETYHDLPSPDLCTLAEDMPVLPYNFLHCINGIQGFRNSSFVVETQGEAQQAKASLSRASTSPIPVLRQDEQMTDRAALQPAEAPCQLDTDFPASSDLHDSNTSDVSSGKADPPIDPSTPAAHATSSFSQPTTLRQCQDEDHCRTAFSSQVPNTGAYLSLKDLQSQYSLSGM
ncbi:interleukin-2 receptor subunit beta [Cyrtonyx montezumae]|uniref:interleukin-2 receptor subunit beta n=1 Tax=Cyrtonyx montezumae TaxID=9017 RepID=UPI0032DA3B3C